MADAFGLVSGDAVYNVRAELHNEWVHLQECNGPQVRPDCVDTCRLEIFQSRGNAVKITNPILIRILKRSGIDLIDHRVCHHHGSPAPLCDSRFTFACVQALDAETQAIEPCRSDVPDALARRSSVHFWVR